MELFLWLHICSDTSHWTSLTRVHLLSVRGRHRGAEGPAQSQSQAGCSATEPGTADRHREGLVEGGRLLMTPGFTGNWKNHLPVLEGEFYENRMLRVWMLMAAVQVNISSFSFLFFPRERTAVGFSPQQSRVMLVRGDREERSAQMGGQYSWTTKQFPSASFVLMSSVLFSPKSRLYSLSLLGGKRCWSRSCCFITGSTHSLRNGPCVGESCGFQLDAAGVKTPESGASLSSVPASSVTGGCPSPCSCCSLWHPCLPFCPNTRRYFYSAVIQFSLTGSVSHSAVLH